MVFSDPCSNRPQDGQNSKYVNNGEVPALEKLLTLFWNLFRKDVPVLEKSRITMRMRPCFSLIEQHAG